MPIVGRGLDEVLVVTLALEVHAPRMAPRLRGGPAPFLEDADGVDELPCGIVGEGEEEHHRKKMDFIFYTVNLFKSMI